MNPNDRCGIGRCRNESVLILWIVPICTKHWDQCCRESDTSLPWLRRKARHEWQRDLPKIDTEKQGPVVMSTRRRARKGHPGLKANSR